MDLKRINEVLNVCQLAGIDEINIEPSDNGCVIRGMERELKSVIYTEDVSGVVENRMFFHRVGDFLKRLALFELDKVTVKEDVREDFTKRLTIKQSRKVTKLALSDPKHCKAPKRPYSDDVVETVIMSEAQVTDLCQAISTMQPKFVCFESDGDEVKYVLTEKGTTDSINDVLKEESSGTEFEVNWDTAIFTKVLKAAIKGEESVELNITSKGNLYIVVDAVQVILVPRIADDF